MPRDSLSLYFSIQSGSSERTLTSLADKTRAFDKETQELKQTTDALTKANKSLMSEQTRLQSELKAAQKTVNDLQKAYDEYGDEMMKLDLDQAIENHAKLKAELSEVNAQLGANQKTYKEYLETVRKGGLDEQQGTGLGDIAKGLAAGQVGQMLASSLGDLGQSVLTSAIGTPEASLISDTLSSAIAGGAAGMIAGPVGAAIGAGLGAISGMISGGTKIFEAQDDAFKEYYGGLYQDVSDRSGEMVEGGSSIASGRQTDRISFKTLLGDRQTADTYLEKLVGMANSTPFLYDDLVAMSKTLATYGYSAKQDMGKAVAGERDDNYILDVLQTIGDTGAALGMGTSDMTAVAQALGRMKSSDKTTLEYLNMLNDRGIGAVGYLADAYGLSQGDIYEKISGGEISGTEAVEIITAALREAYSGSMLEQSQTFAGISSTLEGWEQELENAGGDAYNTLRQSGKSAMVDAYGGELGDAIKEINAIMGENQARRENLQDQYMREVLDAVLNGNRGALWDDLDEKQQADLSAMHEDYISALERYQNGDTDAGAELESLYEQAQLLGQAYFDNSDEVARLNDIEEQEIAAIREATAGLDEATQASYRLSQELSKGLAVRLLDASSFNSREEYAKRGRDGLPGSGGLASPRQSYQSRGHAFGLERVPYDEYPALLHEGERVLTAAQARAQDTGQAGAPIQISITGNNFTGTPEEMAEQLVEVIIRKVSQMNIAAAPK